MHDPSQDHLMIQHMSYFRPKRLVLGETYEQFLRETLPPGATIFLVECQQTWPSIGERYIFQHGGMGSATLEEFFHGGPRVKRFMKTLHERI
jgi:hypothetical protein